MNDDRKDVSICKWHFGIANHRGARVADSDLPRSARRSIRHWIGGGLAYLGGGATNLGESLQDFT